MKFAIVDGRMSEKCKNTLTNLGFQLVALPSNPCYDTPISAHPDIFIFDCCGEYLVDRSVFPIANKQMFFYGEQDVAKRFTVVGENGVGQVRYPHDCSLNFAVCGRYMIGNFRYAAQGVWDLAAKYALTPISVRQGYTKCNVCPVSDEALITEDTGIAAACRTVGLDVLLLEKHAVSLPGYPYGFIGGAASVPITVNDQQTLLFCGDIKAHPEYERIRCFCRSYGVQPVALSDEPLCDYGSIFLVDAAR